MCMDWHAVTMVTISHLLTTTVVCTAPNITLQLTHLSNLTLLQRISHLMYIHNICCPTLQYSCKVTSHLLLVAYSHSTRQAYIQKVVKQSVYIKNLYEMKLFKIAIKPYFAINTHHLVYSACANYSQTCRYFASVLSSPLL